MKLLIGLLVCVAVNAVDMHHAVHKENNDAVSKAKVTEGAKATEGAVAKGDTSVECEGFDAYAVCPGGWPSISADEAQHRVRCCGKAGTKDECPMCNRCKIGSFADSCCTCDDDELVDAFWGALHSYHADPANQDGAVIGQRDLIKLLTKVKGAMDAHEELAIKDTWENIMHHVLTADQKTSSGLAYTAPISAYLRENPDVVSHLVGETESPSEGERQLALDHSKAITPEWHSGMGAGYGSLPPEIIRQTKNGLWEVLVPNFEHPGNGYYPAVYRHSHQEAKAYADEKQAQYLEQEAKQAMMTHNIRAKASENVDLVHHDRQDGKAGFKRYNDQTAGDKASNLVGLVEEQTDTPKDDLEAALDDVAARTDALAALADAPGAVKRVVQTHVESTDLRIERAPEAETVVQPGDETIPMESGSDVEGSDEEGSGSDEEGSGSDEDGGSAEEEATA